MAFNQRTPHHPNTRPEGTASMMVTRSPRQWKVRHEAMSDRPVRMGIDGWVWVVVIATSPLQQLLYSMVSPQVRAIPLAAALLSLMTVRVVKVHGQRVLVVVAALIVIAGLISGMNSNLRASGEVAVTLGLLVALLPPAVAFQLNRYPNFLRNVVVAFLGVQTLSALAAIVQMAGGSVLGVVAVAGRARGLAGHPNILGIMSVIAILILFDLMRRGVINRVLGVALLLVHAVTILGSASLSSMLMLAVGLMFYVFAARGAIRYLLGTLAIVAVVGVLVTANGNLISLLPESLEARVSEVTDPSGDRASLLIRFGAYQYAIDSIAGDPIMGVGMDTMNQSTTQSGLVVHNYLLRGWFQGGLLLFIALTTISAMFVMASARYIRRTGVLAPAAILVSMLVFGLTSSLYTQSHYWVVMLVSFVVMGGLMPKEPLGPLRTVRR
ncbi:O-antigen ligase family protein [Aeromicrobium sp. PE09-221]|uniref:O-antigen ligase family protein n=1 Tax=Aeromicrobium sp. PE09-221 TaxID=1898043 RepID=UPI00148383F6|nr:O-antigen ligase family protein [Aeromicrobium sp. PE09-221]